MIVSKLSIILDKMGIDFLLELLIRFKKWNELLVICVVDFQLSISFVIEFEFLFKMEEIGGKKEVIKGKIVKRKRKLLLDSDDDYYMIRICDMWCLFMEN